MTATRYTCPDCNATLRLPNPAPAGSLIRCPKCNTDFPAQEPATPTVQAAAAPAPAKPKPVAAAKANGRPQRVSKNVPREEDDKDDEDDDPRPKRKFQKKGKAKGNKGLMLGLIIGGAALFLIVLVGGGVIVAMNSDEEKPSTAGSGSGGGSSTTGTGSSGQGQQQSVTPTGKGLTLFGAKNPDKLEKTFDPEKLAQAKLESVGNIDARAANSLEGLNYVPADANVAIGVDVLNLMADPAVAAYIQELEKGGEDAEALQLKVADMDHIVLGMKIDPNQQQDVPPLTIVIKLKQSLDQAKVQAAASGPARQRNGKDYYPMPTLDGDKDQTFFVYLPKDRYLVLTNLPEDGLDALLVLDGSKPAISGDMVTTLKGLNRAHFWAVMSTEPIRQSLPPGAEEQARNQVNPELKALVDGLFEVKAVGLGVRLQDNQVKLTFGLGCDDDGKGKQLADTMRSLWTGKLKPLLAVARPKEPEAAQLLNDLSQSLQVRNQGAVAQVTAQVSFKTVETLAQSGANLEKLPGAFTPPPPPPVVTEPDPPKPPPPKVLKGKERLIGIWENVETQGNTVEFKDDGTITITLPGPQGPQTGSGRWEFVKEEGDNITIRSAIPGSPPTEGSLAFANPDRFTITSKIAGTNRVLGKPTTFSRQGAAGGNKVEGGVIKGGDGVQINPNEGGAGAVNPNPGVGGDLAKLQGTWVSNNISFARLVVEGDKFAVITKDVRGGDIVGEIANPGIVTLDATKSPKEIDLRCTKGPPFIAIYELRGDDLRICIATGRNDRPTEFKDGGKGGGTIYSLKRSR